MKKMVTYMQGNLGEILVDLEVKTEEWGIGTRLERFPFVTKADLVVEDGRKRIYDDAGASPYSMHIKAVSYLEQQGFRRVGTELLRHGVPEEEVWSTGRRKAVLQEQGRELYAHPSRLAKK